MTRSTHKATFTGGRSRPYDPPKEVGFVKKMIAALVAAIAALLLLSGNAGAQNPTVLAQVNPRGVEAAGLHALNQINVPVGTMIWNSGLTRNGAVMYYRYRVRPGDRFVQTNLGPRKFNCANPVRLPSQTPPPRRQIVTTPVVMVKSFSNVNVNVNTVNVNVNVSVPKAAKAKASLMGTLTVRKIVVGGGVASFRFQAIDLQNGRKRFFRLFGSQSVGLRFPLGHRVLVSENAARGWVRLSPRNGELTVTISRRAIVTFINRRVAVPASAKPVSSAPTPTPSGGGGGGGGGGAAAAAAAAGSSSSGSGTTTGSSSSSSGSAAAGGGGGGGGGSNGGGGGGGGGAAASSSSSSSSSGTTVVVVSPPPPAPPANRPPAVTIENPPAHVCTGGQFEFRANFSDPDGDSLHVSWSASGGTISSGRERARFTAGAAGNGSVSVTVSDGKESRTATVNFPIPAEGQGGCPKF